MKLDFSKPAPQAQTLEEAQQIINALWAIVVELQAKVAALEEKLNTNSKNSSKPPSTDGFKSKKLKQHGAGKSKALKQGAQKDHPGKGRELLPPEQVDSIVVCLPEKTCDCSGQIQPNLSQFKRHQQFELPPIKPLVTEYQLVYGTCCGCGKIHCAALPHGVPNTLLGVRATAAIGIFTGDYRLSKRATKLLLSDFFALPVSLGTISYAEATVSAALEQPVEELKAYIQQQPVVHADETSHKQQGKTQWMWLATTLLVAVFIIRSRRCMDSAKAVLGEKFMGILISDRYSAYNWIQSNCRQFCWAHLKRDMQKISECSGKVGKIGDDILEYIRRMFRLWRKLKVGEISRQTFKLAMIPIRKDIERLLTDGTTCGHTKTANTCKNILKHKTALWNFVDVEGVEPTNNLAEQQIRFYVLWRKSSFGTQSERGNRFVERMMTTTATCKLQGKNRYEFLTSAVGAYFKNQPAPSLLPVQQKSDYERLAA
jgi:transposase